jgi:protein O-mannosyl-transferase
LLALNCRDFIGPSLRRISQCPTVENAPMNEPEAIESKANKARVRARAARVPRKLLDRPFVLAACLAGVTLAVYGRSLALGFVHLDDPVYVTGNAHVLTGLNYQNVRWSFVGIHDANWIPFTWLSLILDAQFFGTGPFGFHFTNVVLHVGNTLLLFYILFMTTRSMRRSAFVAALFALHPLHVESVAWVAERKDVLSILFGLLSILAYVHFAKNGGRPIWTASLLLFVCSLMTKQTLVTMPFLLLLLDYWPLERFGFSSPERKSLDAAAPVPPPTIGRLVLEKVPFFAVSVAFSLIAISAQRQALGPLKLFPFSARCANAVLAYADYLRQAILPFDLNAFYPYFDSTPIVSVIVAAVLLLAVSTAAGIWIRRFPFFFVGWAWYLGTLVPMIGLVQVGAQRHADRYTYFPLIGIFIAATWLASQLVPAGVLRARLVPIVAAASLAAFAATSIVQIGYWGDSVTLYQRALEFAPGNAYLLSSLGFSLVNRGDVTEGLKLLEESCRTPPLSSKRHFALALALQKVGRLEEASAEYRETIALDNTDAEAHSNLAIILTGQKQLEAAREQLLEAIQVDPDYVKAYINIGVVCMGLGRYDDVITYSQKALEIDPSLLECHVAIAMALRAQGRYDEAANRFRYLMHASRDDGPARLELERTLELKRRSGVP